MIVRITAYLSQPHRLGWRVSDPRSRELAVLTRIVAMTDSDSFSGRAWWIASAFGEMTRTVVTMTRTVMTVLVTTALKSDH